MYDLLNSLEAPEDVKKMSLSELGELSKEIRMFLLEKVSKTGGHLASNLGVVELTISLYNVFDFKKDKLIWDVGHQAYVHKILTGRKDEFDNLRKYNGISGFPKPEESAYDFFKTGHSSTSISAALGMARARDLRGEKSHVVAVIGDGAMTGGMAWEALNDAGFSKTKVIIILNDNQMSIGKNVGGMSTYLSKMRIDPSYNKIKSDFKATLEKSNIGRGVANGLDKIKDSIKQFFVPGMVFEEIGLKYFGPIDGHNVKELSKVMDMAKKMKGPVIIHAITKKGKGYSYAEKNPNKFHGVSPFEIYTGEVIKKSEAETYSQAFGDEMMKLAEKHKNLVAITAAMRDGTGLTEFSAKFRRRFFDVGIAEQHAVTLAAGMAMSGLTPVFAVYSTFLQRAYDQILHDVCTQNLPVIFAIDRAGIVGEDGETHQGVFDISYLYPMPNMVILAPKCTDELRKMLDWAVNYGKCPVAIRYPKGSEDIKMNSISEVVAGKWEEIYGSGDIAIVAVGKMVASAIAAREKLLKLGVEISVISAYSVKPMDTEMLNNLAKSKKMIITLEDNSALGGFGSYVLNYLNNIDYNGKVINNGFKDEFIQQGECSILYKLYGLDAESIVSQIVGLLD
ncbi:1-deoxy-D-xylulose-5-phosphate synthase [Clostridium oryzae]|nr:1-deoxy-D-xylulose-5-phosphate synthase [Clostridium oryzae]